MKILALDLATATGHACGDSAGSPTYGTFTLPSTGEDVGRLLVAFNAWLHKKIEVEDPEYIVFEAPILVVGRTSVQVARKLMGLSTFTEFLACSLGIAYREASIQSVKKFWTGGGNAGKGEMVRMARIYGFNPPDDNAADALALWYYSAHLLDPKHARRIGPLEAAAERARA